MQAPRASLAHIDTALKREGDFMTGRRRSAEADAKSIWRRAQTLAADAQKLVDRCNEEGLIDYDPDFLHPRVVGTASARLRDLLEAAQQLECAAEDACGALDPDVAQ